LILDERHASSMRSLRSRVWPAACLAAIVAACGGGSGTTNGGDGGSDGASSSGATGSSSGAAGSSGSSSGSGSGGSSNGSNGGSNGSSGGDSSTGGSGSSSGNQGSSGGSSGGGDASMAYDAINSAGVMWGQPCLYNFGSSCPFPPGQECGNHQAISVTFPNGPQLLNATLFAGLDCSPNALQDNFNDQQNTRASELWMFTDDADVAGVSASNPTSAIWWVGPLTSNGFPPAGAPTTGCINYTIAMAMCQ
jgi:hypothetical protein